MTLTYSSHQPSGTVLVWQEGKPGEFASVYADLSGSGGSFDEKVSRARLIAKTPELLDALSELIAVVETYEDAWNPNTDLYVTRDAASDVEREARAMTSIHPPDGRAA